MNEISLSSVIEAVIEDYSERAAFSVGETFSEDTDSLTMKLMEENYGDYYN